MWLSLSPPPQGTEGRCSAVVYVVIRDGLIWICLGHFTQRICYSLSLHALHCRYSVDHESPGYTAQHWESPNSQWTPPLTFISWFFATFICLLWYSTMFSAVPSQLGICILQIAALSPFVQSVPPCSLLSWDVLLATGLSFRDSFAALLRIHSS